MLSSIVAQQNQNSNYFFLSLYEVSFFLGGGFLVLWVFMRDLGRTLFGKDNEIGEYDGIALKCLLL